MKIKFLYFGFVFGLFIFVSIGILTFFSFKKDIKTINIFFSSIVDNKTENFDENYFKIKKIYSSWFKRISFLNVYSFGLIEHKYHVLKTMGSYEQLMLYFPEILGKEGEKIYFILLQNNMEIRATGGFMGSYVKLKFKNGGLSNMVIQDIYVPDGQIPGHVEPPPPIQEAFKQGFWKLRDSNWDPDFSQAAKVIAWFFEKGKEDKADGVIAVNYSIFGGLLKIIGPIELLDYKTTVNEKNLYSVLQSYSEANFFPGSTQKKDILSEFGLNFFEQLKKINGKKMLKVFLSLNNALNEREIYLFFQNALIENGIHKNNWDGSMQNIIPTKSDEILDYLFVVESNLGVNKANYYIDRKVEHFVNLNLPDQILGEVKITFNNKNEFSAPKPPIFYGGDYLNYLRVYFPINVKVTKVIFDGKEVESKKILVDSKSTLGLQGIGFFIKVPSKSEKEVSISYDFSKDLKVVKEYRLVVQKQPGIRNTPYILKLKSKGKEYIKSFILNQDQEMFVPLKYN